MELLERNGQAAKRDTSRVVPKGIALASFLIVGPAVLRVVAPLSLLIFQVFLDLCQLCITTVRIYGW